MDPNGVGALIDIGGYEEDAAPPDVCDEAAASFLAPLLAPNENPLLVPMLVVPPKLKPLDFDEAPPNENPPPLEVAVSVFPSALAGAPNEKPPDPIAPPAAAPPKLKPDAPIDPDVAPAPPPAALDALSSKPGRGVSQEAHLFNSFSLNNIQASHFHLSLSTLNKLLRLSFSDVEPPFSAPAASSPRSPSSSSLDSSSANTQSTYQETKSFSSIMSPGFFSFSAYLA